MKDTINDIWIKCKDLINIIKRRDIFLIFIIFFISLGSFGLGFLAGNDIKRPQMTIKSAEYDFSKDSPASVGGVFSELTENKNISRAGGFVASKNGTSYHYPWCPGAEKIKEENKVWFKSSEDAEAAGYTAAKNCKGL